MFRGVYVDASVPGSPGLRVDAALLLFHETAFASHASAARVRGVPLPTLPEEHVSVLHPDHRRARSGICCHLVGGAEVRTVDGRRVSAVTRMLVELAELLGFVDLVIVGDHLVRRRKVTCVELGKAAAAAGGERGRAARRAAAFVRERVDSPMETRLRLLIVLAGVPEPQVNRVIRDLDGEPVRRYDLSWPTVRVVVEYDGRQHIEREAAWESDLDRREAMDDEGQRLLVVTAKGIYTDPGRTVERVFRVLRARGLAGLPDRPRDDWRPHFPGHAAATV